MKITKRTKGYTLLELLMVIGLVAVLTTGSYMMYEKVALTSKVEKQASLLRHINQIGVGFAAMDRYDNITTANLVNANAIPSYALSGTNITDIFGSSITIAPQTMANALPATPPSVVNSYYIQMVTDDKNICLRTVSTLEKDFDAVEVGATFIKRRGTTPIAFNMASLTTACATITTATNIKFSKMKLSSY